jgi:phospholipase/lecithinase/hemolysin
MKFKLDVTCGAALAVLAVTLLASCGGGTQIDPFVPKRIVVLGDESSRIEADPNFAGQGRKYTVNGVQLDATTGAVVPPTTRLCSINQIWVQVLAYSYGFSFPECATAGYSATGEMKAEAGAKAAQLSAQVTTLLAGAVASNDLVTVMLGTNDIIDAAEHAADPGAAVTAAGTQVGAEVIRITDRGAKVIVSTVPDLGFSPYAINLEVTSPGTIAKMSDLTKQFNTALRLKLEQVRDGGRAVGLVLADDLVSGMVRNPAAYGLTVIGQPACFGVLLPDCDMTTLDSTAVVASHGYDWLWADDRHLGANAQSRIGSLAVTRARNNPF